MLVHLCAPDFANAMATPSDHVSWTSTNCYGGMGCNNCSYANIPNQTNYSYCTAQLLREAICEPAILSTLIPEGSSTALVDLDELKSIYPELFL